MNNKCKICSVLLITLIFIFAFVSCATDSNKIHGFEMHFLDVGQADSTIIFLPDNKTMLIDGGNNSDGELIEKHLKKYGIDKIDFLIGTHPHEDHIGGLSHIIENFKIGEIYMPKVVHDSETYTNLLETIAEHNYTINTASKGITIIENGEYSANIISPVREKYSDLNHYSVIIKLVYKNTSYLFTGDAEIINEKELEGDISADVLKVGHHGSDTSSSDEFLDRVNPDYAIISVGTDNKYDHPSDEVLKRLKERNVKIFRTDKNKTIRLKSDGNTISVKGEK